MSEISFWRFYHLRFKSGFVVLRHLHLHAAVTAVDPLRLIAIAVVIAVRVL